MARRITKGSMGLRLELHSSEVQKHMGKYLDLAGDEPIGIVKGSWLVAVLLSVDEYEQFQRLKDAFIAAGAGNERSRAWHDEEKALRLSSELSKRSRETDD